MALFCALLAAVGCGGDNGILTVDFTLPAASDTRTFALIEAHDGDGGFIGEGADRISVPLASGATTASSVEIVAGDDKVDDPFRVRVRFCTDADCTTDADAVGKAPAAEYLFVRATYANHRTSFQATVPDIATLEANAAAGRITVGQCEVQGCGPAEATSWCREDGSHLCE